MYDNDFLKHWGILGMRWGKKKSSAPTTIVRTSNSEDHDRKNVLKSKKLNELTNDELRTLTQRVALEKQYKEIKKGEISLGKKIAKNLVDSAIKGANDAASDYVKKYAAKKVEDLIAKTVKAAV